MDQILMGCEYLETKKNEVILKWGQPNPQKLLKEETYRTNFRRQRDRILYLGGFRRLQDKTQVISATKSGDHRTRLTHTLEVEQIAISLSYALALNSDLVSAIAIGHDVGHTPFGHAVERLLDQKLIDKGGFSHALQSVRYLGEKIVRTPKNPEELDPIVLQQMYDVIDLQKLIFEGILKHDTDVYSGNYNSQQVDCTTYRLDEAGTLEMQVVYWSDKIAYLTHDLEDFIKTGIYINAIKKDPSIETEILELISGLTATDLKTISKFETRDLIRSLIARLLENSKENIVRNSLFDCNQMQDLTTERIKKREKELAKDKGIGDEKLDAKYINELKNIIRNNEIDIENEKMLLNLKKLSAENIADLQEKEAELKSHKEEFKKIQDIKKDAFVDGLIINFDDDYREIYKKLRKKLNKHYILSPEITRSDAKAERIASRLFDDFVNNPKLLPLNIQDRTKSDSIERVVADYIASMTDRYAELIYADLNSIGGHYEY